MQFSTKNSKLQLSQTPYYVEKTKENKETLVIIVVPLHGCLAELEHTSDSTDVGTIGATIAVLLLTSTRVGSQCPSCINQS